MLGARDCIMSRNVLANIEAQTCVCVCVLLEVCERRGRLLHHLARASCHISENLTNSIVPLVSHWLTPSDRWCLNATTWTPDNKTCALVMYSTTSLCILMSIDMCASMHEHVCNTSGNAKPFIKPLCLELWVNTEQHSRARTIGIKQQWRRLTGFDGLRFWNYLIGLHDI